MKDYLVRLSAKDRSILTPKLLEGHVNHLRSLDEKGHLRVCGPCEDGTAVLILRADSRSSVEELVSADPFVSRGFYRERKILEFTSAEQGNNFLFDQVNFPAETR